MLAYLRSKGYSIPLDHKTHQPTTNEKALSGILRNVQDPVISRSLDIREITKAKAYLSPKFVHSDGRYHPTYTYTPDSGRLAAQAPPIQQQPKRMNERFIRMIRETIVCDEGLVLVECDWQAVEAVLTGWFAEDEDYIWLSLQDSHSFYCSYLQTYWGTRSEPLRLDMDRDYLLKELKRIKKECEKERDMAKMLNLALGYGMGPYLLAEHMRCTHKDAQEFIRLKEAMAPKVSAWQKKTQRQAQEEGKLVTPFGYVRFFFDVFRKDKMGVFRPNGKEANKALSFLPQSTASTMMRRFLLDLFRSEGCFSWWWPVATIHDAVLFEVTESRLEEFMAFLRPLFERSWAELNGLLIPGDFAYGRAWSKSLMEKI